MTSLAVSRAWLKNVDKIYENRLYDVELRLKSTASPVLLQRLAALPGIGAVEQWDYSPAALARPGRVDLVHTYPDKGHGSLSVMAAPSKTNLVKLPLLAGRWLKADDSKAVVLNHVAAAQRPSARIGDEIVLSAAGRIRRLTLAGIVEEVGSPGVAYVSSQAFAQLAHSDNRGRLLRIATMGSGAKDRAQALPTIEKLLTQEKVGV